MGAGSSDFRLPSSTGSSEKKFQKEMDESKRFESAEGKTRNVFISFNTDDEWAVNLLRSQAKDDRFDVEFRDYSIKDPFDHAWKTQAKDVIDKTSVTIVMIGQDTASRDAVDWEIRQAHEQGKKVIGVRIHKDKDHQVPKAMIEHGDTVINWDLQKLKELLK